MAIFPLSLVINSKSYLPMAQRFWTVPAVGRFGLTLHDYERADRWIDSSNYSNGAVSYQLRNENVPLPIHRAFKANAPESAFPETVRLWGEAPSDYVPLSKDWQWFWYALMEEASEHTFSKSEMMMAWESMTAHGRAFTDRHAREQGFTDHVLGVNYGSDKGDMQHMTLSCGGNLVKILGTQGDFYIIEALNLFLPPPDPKIAIKQNWLVHWANQCTVLKLPDGRWRVYDFPQLRPYGSPFLIVSRDGTNLIRREHVKTIKNGEVYSPYVEQL